MKRSEVKNTGFDSIDDNFSSSHSERQNYQDYEVVRISVHDGKGGLE